MNSDIRPYGPGKFSTLLDAYVWAITLDGGPDKQCSWPDGGEWHGLLLDGPAIIETCKPDEDTLNKAELAKLSNAFGMIISEGSEGFVIVEYYTADEASDLEKDWASIEKAMTVEEEETT